MILLSVIHLGSLIFLLVSLLLLLASYHALDQPWVYGAMAVYLVSFIVFVPKAWGHYKRERHRRALVAAVVPVVTAVIAFVAYAVIWPR